MKIAMLNMWKTSAEKQAIASIRLAAADHGIEVVECANSAELLMELPDLVLAMSSNQAKTTDLPTYGIIHEAPRHFLERPDFFNNLLSYDGHFAISDSIREFLSYALIGVGRNEEIGYYYNTAHRKDWTGTIEFTSARLTYFGMNWDDRMHSFFKLLSREYYVDVYGPEKTWAHIEKSAFRGSLPFDGDSVVATYRASGVGLAIFSANHLAEEVVSNRIFEIASGGALCIAHRMRWIEKEFGDTVLYIDQNAPAAVLVRQIRGHMAWVRENPEAAAARAAEMQRIFRRKFSMNVLLENVLETHGTYLRRRAAQRAGKPVAVILDASQEEAARDLLGAVGRQTHGPIELLLTDKTPLSAAAAESAFPDRFASVRSIPSDLRAAIQEVRSDHVLILNETCRPFRDHIAELVDCLARAPKGPGPAFSYSGRVQVCAEPFRLHDDITEDRRLLLQPAPSSPEDIVDWLDHFNSGALLLPRGLLEAALARLPEAEDVWSPVLMLELLEEGRPVFSFRGSLEVRTPREGATQDAAAARRRLVWAMTGRTWSPVAPALGPTRLAAFVGSLYERERHVEETSAGFTYLIPPTYEVGFDYREGAATAPFTLEMETAGLSGQVSEDLLPIEVNLPSAAWAYGLSVQLTPPPWGDRNYVIRVELQVEGGSAGVGILNSEATNFAYRVFAEPAQESTVFIPVLSRGAPVRFVVCNDDHGLRPRVTIRRVTLLADAESAPIDLGPNGREHVLLLADLAPRFDYVSGGRSCPLTVAWDDVRIAGAASGPPASRQFPLAVEIALGAPSTGLHLPLTLPGQRGGAGVLRLAVTITGEVTLGVTNGGRTDFVYGRTVRGKGRRLMLFLPVPEEEGAIVVTARSNETGEGASISIDAAPTLVAGSRGPASPPEVPRNYHVVEHRAELVGGQYQPSHFAPLSQLLREPPQFSRNSKPGPEEGLWPISLNPPEVEHANGMVAAIDLPPGDYTFRIQLAVGVGAIELCVFDPVAGVFHESFGVEAGPETHVVYLAATGGRRELMLRNVQRGVSRTVIDGIEISSPKARDGRLSLPSFVRALTGKVKVAVDWGPTGPHRWGSSLVEIRTPDAPWSTARHLPIRPESDQRDIIALIKTRVRKGVAGFGILDRGGGRFLVRDLRPAQAEPMTIALPFRVKDAGALVIQNAYLPGSAEIELEDLAFVPAFDLFGHLNYAASDVAERPIELFGAKSPGATVRREGVAMPPGSYRFLVGTALQQSGPDTALMLVSIWQDGVGFLFHKSVHPPANGDVVAIDFEVAAPEDAYAEVSFRVTCLEPVAITYAVLVGSAGDVRGRCRMESFTGVNLLAGLLTVTNGVNGQDGVLLEASRQPQRALICDIGELPPGRYRISLEGDVYAGSGSAQPIVNVAFREQGRSGRRRRLWNRSFAPRALRNGDAAVDFDVPDRRSQFQVVVDRLLGPEMLLKDVRLDALDQAWSLE